MATKSIRSIEGVNRKDAYSINPFKIVVDWTENPREQYEAEDDFKIETLMNQIAEYGVLVPLNVKVDGEGNVRLTQGFRRMKAIQRLKEERGIEIQSVLVTTAPPNEELENLMHLILNSGKNLTEYELGKILHKHQQTTGQKAMEIAKVTGFDYQKVTKLISLFNDSSEKLLEMVENGEVAVNTAVQITKIADTPEAQDKLIEELESGVKERNETDRPKRHSTSTATITMSDVKKSQKDKKGNKKDEVAPTAKTETPKAEESKEENSIETPNVEESKEQETEKPKANKEATLKDVLGALAQAKGQDTADLQLIAKIELIIATVQKGESIEELVKEQATA